MILAMDTIVECLRSHIAHKDYDASAFRRAAIVVTGTGFFGRDRVLVRQLCGLVDIEYVGDLKPNKTTLLLCRDAHMSRSSPSLKMASAFEWGLPVVALDWLLDSIWKGRPLSVESYAINAPRGINRARHTCQPNRREGGKEEGREARPHKALTDVSNLMVQLAGTKIECGEEEKALRDDISLREWFPGFHEKQKKAESVGDATRTGMESLDEVLGHVGEDALSGCLSVRYPTEASSAWRASETSSEEVQSSHATHEVRQIGPSRPKQGCGDCYTTTNDGVFYCDALGPEQTAPTTRGMFRDTEAVLRLIDRTNLPGSQLNSTQAPSEYCLEIIEEDPVVPVDEHQQSQLQQDEAASRDQISATAMPLQSTGLDENEERDEEQSSVENECHQTIDGDQKLCDATHTWFEEAPEDFLAELPPGLSQELREITDLLQCESKEEEDTWNAMSSCVEGFQTGSKSCSENADLTTMLPSSKYTCPSRDKQRELYTGSEIMLDGYHRQVSLACQEDSQQQEKPRPSESASPSLDFFVLEDENVSVDDRQERASESAGTEFEGSDVSIREGYVVARARGPCYPPPIVVDVPDDIVPLKMLLRAPPRSTVKSVYRLSNAKGLRYAEEIFIPRINARYSVKEKGKAFRLSESASPRQLILPCKEEKACYMTKSGDDLRGHSIPSSTLIKIVTIYRVPGEDWRAEILPFYHPSDVQDALLQKGKVLNSREFKFEQHEIILGTQRLHVNLSSVEAIVEVRHVKAGRSVLKTSAQYGDQLPYFYRYGFDESSCECMAL